MLRGDRRGTVFNLCINGQGPALRPEDLDTASAKLGCPIPSTLREFYLAYNGGRPTSSVFLNEEEDDYEVASFMSIGARRHPNEPTLEETFETMVRQKQLLEEEMIPFGRDSGGNLFCIHRKSQAIWYWVADTANEESRLTEIADSLGDFLDGLLDGG